MNILSPGDSIDNHVSVLVVDDNLKNRKVLRMMLELEGYSVRCASDGDEALESLLYHKPDIMLLDILMPGISGVEVCKRVREQSKFETLPIVLITALDSREQFVKGLDAGADDFIQKPVDRNELLARIRSCLRVSRLHQAVHEREAELAQLNASLDQRVKEQTAEIARLERLKRYLAPTIADSIVNGGREDLLGFHRARIAALCCDLRNFTPFGLRAEPEETIDFLNEYYGTLGPLVMAHQGTIDHFTGDGMLVFFNDPIECDDPALRAVRLAIELREGIKKPLKKWSLRGYEMGFGSGITFGYATMGEVGFEGRREYAGTGTPVNLASRLADLAIDGQILVSQSVAAEVSEGVSLNPLGPKEIRGFPESINLWEVAATDKRHNVEELATRQP